MCIFKFKKLQEENLKLLEEHFLLTESCIEVGKSNAIYKSVIKETLNKLASVKSHLLVLQKVCEQTSNYTDEQLVFDSVQAYAKYINAMISLILDSEFKEDDENDEEEHPNK